MRGSCSMRRPRPVRSFISAPAFPVPAEIRAAKTSAHQRVRYVHAVHLDRGHDAPREATKLDVGQVHRLTGHERLNKRLGLPRQPLLGLALKIIDIGYQALAVKMHPDKKTGSEDAMTRLNVVRDKTKTAVRRYFK